MAACWPGEHPRAMLLAGSKAFLGCGLGAPLGSLPAGTRPWAVRLRRAFPSGRSDGGCPGDAAKLAPQRRSLWLPRCPVCGARVSSGADPGARALQVMKMMGLNNAVHWVAWFITGFVQLSISVTALTAILKYGKVLMHSDVVIIWLFLAIYAVATIMFW